MAKISAKDQAERDHVIANVAYTTRRSELRNGKWVQHVCAEVRGKPGYYKAYQIVHETDGTITAGRLPAVCGELSAAAAKIAADGNQDMVVRIDEQMWRDKR